MILVDTSVWIDFLEGRDTLCRKVLHDLIDGQEDVCLAGIILTEILQGIREEKAARLMQSYLLDFPIFDPSGIQTYIQAARIFRACRRKGKTVRKTVDSLIAAVAIENDLPLLHNDADFDKIAQCTDLKIWRADQVHEK